MRDSLVQLILGSLLSFPILYPERSTAGFLIPSGIPELYNKIAPFPYMSVSQNLLRYLMLQTPQLDASDPPTKKSLLSEMFL